MSVADIPLPVNASDDIWHQNKAEIRNLYQNQRKTLREVKYLMELKGFPEKPLSTWEAKLRDVLQLRKKAKATNWPLIYQHILPRLENPGQKELRRRTVIYLNGSEIPWDKAWKEMRRSRAMALSLRARSPSPLPSGIVIRTPSPVAAPYTPAVGAAQLTDETIPTQIEHARQEILPRHPSGLLPTAQVAIGNDEPRSVAQYAISVYQECATTIPWVGLHQVLQTFLQHLDGSLHREASDLSVSIITSSVGQVWTDDFQISFDFLPAGYPNPPRPSHDLGCRVAISAARFHLDEFISTTMYLLSNDLHDHFDADRGLDLFCSILERDTRQTINILYRRLPSVRSAWLHLLRYSVERQRRDTFRLMIDIGIRNAWLCSQSIASLLCPAVAMDCDDSLKGLLTYEFKSGSYWWTEGLRAVITAIRNENDDCVQLLVEHCHLDSQNWSQSVAHEKFVKTFLELICAIDFQNASDMRALGFMLAIGGDVDEALDLPSMYPPRDWIGTETVFYRPRLTILDYSFYFYRPLYEKLAPNSRVSATEISRTGILLALENGTTALQDYLAMRVGATPVYSWEHVHSYLELILAEQFMLLHPGPPAFEPYFSPPRVAQKEIDLELVRALSHYGIDLKMPSLGIDIQDLLRAVLWQLSRNVTDDGTELIAILIASGASIEGTQLRMAVERHGFSTLECLALLVEDFPAKAVLALAEAARLNNFEAVMFLIQAGVNPCSFVSREERNDRFMDDRFIHDSFKYDIFIDDRPMENTSYSVQAIAATGLCSSSCAMMQFLAEHGAGLVVTPNDSSPFDIIHYLLMHNYAETFQKVKYVIRVLRKCKMFSSIPSYLLESCFNKRGLIDRQSNQEYKDRLKIFEYLVNQGASVSQGFCLAALIRAGGQKQLVENVLRSGADLNAYHPGRRPVWTRRERRCTSLQAAAKFGDESLVRLLLQAGSNVNSRACGGWRSQTALQAICSWDTATEEEYERKIRICQLLIDHGADTNGAPARIWGYTALQCAASVGHLEIAALLLRNGARVNAPSCVPDGDFALDLAASFGRLDMVKFLLNANALSHFRGTTGYDGAIQRAERRNMAIADMIREHAANNMALGLINPELLKAKEDYEVYGYATIEDYYDPDSDGEDCTIDSLCRGCTGIPPRSDEELTNEELTDKEELIG